MLTLAADWVRDRMLVARGRSDSVVGWPGWVAYCACPTPVSRLEAGLFCSRVFGACGSLTSGFRFRLVRWLRSSVILDPPRSCPLLYRSEILKLGLPGLATVYIYLAARLGLAVSPSLIPIVTPTWLKLPPLGSIVYCTIGSPALVLRFVRWELTAWKTFHSWRGSRGYCTNNGLLFSSASCTCSVLPHLPLSPYGSGVMQICETDRRYAREANEHRLRYKQTHGDVLSCRAMA